MPSEFKWTSKIVAWLAVIVLVGAIFSYNMPRNPSPGVTVFLPGYQLIEIAITLLGIALLMVAFRKRSLFPNFELNWLESFVALNGAALFIAPFTSFLFEVLLQVVTNVGT